MRIIVCPHDLSIGGSQINAIDLAAAVAAEGHDVGIYAIPGPLVGYIEERGLRFIPAHSMKYRPAPTRIAQLRRMARREGVDLIHTYEWPTCLDAFFGAGLLGSVPLLCTVLSMSVSPLVPAGVPLIMGTEDLGDEARERHRAPVWVLEPPIDTRGDNPAIDGTPFRRQHGVGDDEMLIVSVSRLSLDLKIDALVRAVDAAELLAARHPFRLLLVGGGPAFDALSERVAGINGRCGREVVTLAGPMLDPRSAYAAADIVLGMGSSALRAAAIGRPVVVQGENAFSEIFALETLDLFLRQGFYGHADNEKGAQRLAAQIEGLIVDPARRETLRRFGSETVEKRFSLARATRWQIGIYESILQQRPRQRWADGFAAARQALRVEIENHDPRVTRRRTANEEATFAAVRSGPWPPG